MKLAGESESDGSSLSGNRTTYTQEEFGLAPSGVTSADNLEEVDNVSIVGSKLGAAAEAAIGVVSSEEDAASAVAPTAGISSKDSIVGNEAAASCVMEDASEGRCTKTTVQSSMDATTSLANTAVGLATDATKDSTTNATELKLLPPSPSSSAAAAEASPAFCEVDESDETVALRVRRCVERAFQLHTKYRSALSFYSFPTLASAYASEAQCSFQALRDSFAWSSFTSSLYGSSIDITPVAAVTQYRYLFYNSCALSHPRTVLCLSGFGARSRRTWTRQPMALMRWARCLRVRTRVGGTPTLWTLRSSGTHRPFRCHECFMRVYSEEGN